jgi:hypothetical protein
MKAAKILFLILLATSLQSLAYAQSGAPEILNTPQMFNLIQSDDQTDPSGGSGGQDLCVSPKLSKDGCYQVPTMSLEELSSGSACRFVAASISVAQHTL